MIGAGLLALTREWSRLIMTLEQLIRNHEQAKANAARSRSAEERETYFDLVTYYAERIRAAKKRGARQETHWLDDERPQESDR